MATLTERHHTLGHRVLFGAGPRCLIQATSPSLTVLSGLQFPSPASRLRKARSMDRLGQCFGSSGAMLSTEPWTGKPRRKACKIRRSAGKWCRVGAGDCGQFPFAGTGRLVLRPFDTPLCVGEPRARSKRATRPSRQENGAWKVFRSAG